MNNSSNIIIIILTIYFIYDKNVPESNDGNNADNDTDVSRDKPIVCPSTTSLDKTNRKNTTENTNNNDHPTMMMLIASLDKTSRLRSHGTPPTHERNKPQW